LVDLALAKLARLGDRGDQPGALVSAGLAGAIDSRRGEHRGSRRPTALNRVAEQSAAAATADSARTNHGFRMEIDSTSLRRVFLASNRKSTKSTKAQDQRTARLCAGNDGPVGQITVEHFQSDP
jgi:hypothetical protein